MHKPYHIHSIIPLSSNLSQMDSYVVITLPTIPPSSFLIPKEVYDKSRNSDDRLSYNKESSIINDVKPFDIKALQRPVKVLINE
uniref:Uncharacterized protein n=1 Tax=Acrobeloides nanus TaxID=290746 RepID=A0A914CF74_9BILA